jgi:hypothetical protein
MKFMVISIILFILIYSSDAFDFSFELPASIKLNEEFSVSINLETSEVFDVKIIVHNSSDDKITSNEVISRIYKDGKWNSAWKYLSSAFPKEKSFRIIIFTNPGVRKICVRLRKVGQSQFFEKCQEIRITSVEIETGLKEKSQNLHEVSYFINQKNNSFLENNEENTKKEINFESFDDKITLSNKPQTEAFLSKQKLINDWIIRVFILFTLILILLVILKYI